MNVFIIPSWYPTAAKPHAGIFNREQAEAMAFVFPESNFAISSWGSHDPHLQLWAKDHFRNLKKLLKFSSREAGKKELLPNLLEYYTPALTWSRAIFGGNIAGISKTCEQHFLDFRNHKGKVDIIHAHSAFPAGWIAMTLASKYRIPYLITEHMTPFPFRAFLKRNGDIKDWLLKPLQNAACNIAVSPQQQETLRQWQIPKLRHIPNLVNEDFFTPAPEQHVPSEPFTFFTLGRMEPQKGIPYLLEAFKLLLKQSELVQHQPQLRLKIGGEGAEKAHYEALAIQLGIADKVEWLGLLNRTQALQQYQQCSAFVLPSLHENLPLVLLEAMACGKALLGTYCGGSESLINENNGLLVEAANSQALADAMLRIQESIGNYSAEVIRAEFCRSYSRKVVCKQIMQTYQDAIAAHSN